MEKRTEISTIGEFGLIQRIASSNSLPSKATVQGIGDDAAVLAVSSEHTLASTELFTENIDFDLSYMPLRHLGYKIVVAAMSDILAMNGTPRQLLLGMGISNRFSVEAVNELTAGVKAACEHYHLDWVGGDTTSTKTGLVLAPTVLGTVSKITYRRGVQPNDIICLSGDVGGAYLGLQLLEREKQVFLENPDSQPLLDGHEYVLQRQLKPEARLDVVQSLSKLGIVPTAMIDLSDGLASELLHLSAQSGVGIKVFEESIPIHQKSYLAASELRLNPLTAAFNGGEDYELLFTIRQEDYQKLLDNTTDISFIGFATHDPAEQVFITKLNEAIPLTAQGWMAPLT